MKKIYLILFVLVSGIIPFLPVFAKEEAIIGLSEHELGDQTIALNAGLYVPLSFVEFDGTVSDPNQTLGGVGAIQWNAYLNSFFRLGLEAGMSFSFGPKPNRNVFLMVPLTVKATFLLNYDRFEFPFFLGLGANVVKYGTNNLYDVALIAKPGAAVYYRYNSNLSFGLNLIWWLNLEFPAVDYNHAIVGNALEVSPSIFYHF